MKRPSLPALKGFVICNPQTVIASRGLALSNIDAPSPSNKLMDWGFGLATLTGSTLRLDEYDGIHFTTTVETLTKI